MSLVTQGQSVIKSMCCVDIHILGVISWKTKGTVYLLFTRENRKFRLENQMVRIISFRKLQKIWAVIWEDAINLFFYPFQSVQLILDLLCSGSFTHHFKFNRLIFLHKYFHPGGLWKWCTSSRVQQCSPKSISPMFLLVILYYLYMRNFCNLIGLEHSASFEIPKRENYKPFAGSSINK